MSKIFPTDVDPSRSPARERVLFRNLRFEDNFNGFLWTGSIEAGEELRIQNKMRDGTIPVGFVIKTISGQPTLVAGPTEWDRKAVYLKNTASTSTVTATVYFYR